MVSKLLAWDSLLGLQGCGRLDFEADWQETILGLKSLAGMGTSVWLFIAKNLGFLGLNERLRTLTLSGEHWRYGGYLLGLGAAGCRSARDDC